MHRQLGGIQRAEETQRKLIPRDSNLQARGLRSCSGPSTYHNQDMYPKRGSFLIMVTQVKHPFRNTISPPSVAGLSFSISLSCSLKVPCDSRAGKFMQYQCSKLAKKRLDEVQARQESQYLQALQDLDREISCLVLPSSKQASPNTELCKDSVVSSRGCCARVAIQVWHVCVCVSVDDVCAGFVYGCDGYSACFLCIKTCGFRTHACKQTMCTTLLTCSLSRSFPNAQTHEPFSDAAGAADDSDHQIDHHHHGLGPLGMSSPV